MLQLNMMIRSHRFAYLYSKNGYVGSHILWKIIDTFTKRPINKTVVILPDGMPLTYEHDDWTCRTIYEGTYERELLSVLRNYKGEMLYVDAGANLGATLWNAMSNLPASSNWLAFEPSNRCWDQLKNVGERIPSKGILMPIALSNRNGTSFLSGSNNPNHSGVGTLRSEMIQTNDSVSISISTLDEVMSKNNPNSTISLLKIDTEGHESEVLSGALGLIQQGKVLNLILEVSPMFGSLSYLEELESNLPTGYKWYEIREAGVFKKFPKLVETDFLDCKTKKNQFNLLIVSQPEKFEDTL